MQHQSPIFDFKSMKRQKTCFPKLFLLAREKFLFLINFETPILFSQYFFLTKLLHDSLINFQHNKYTTQSIKTIFLIHTLKPEDESLIVDKEINTSYKDFQEFISSFKKIASAISCQNIRKYEKIPALQEKATFIEYLVTTDQYFIQSSLRQVKASINRSHRKFSAAIDKTIANIDDSIATIEQVIDFFEQQFLKWLQDQSRTLTPNGQDNEIHDTSNGWDISWVTTTVGNPSIKPQA